MVEARNTYNSGDMNTTGREPFETPYGDNANSNTGAGTGIGAGTGAQQPATGSYGEVGSAGNVGVTGGVGHHHSHHQHHHERQEHSHHQGGALHQGGVSQQQGSGVQVGDSYGSNPTSTSDYQDKTGGLNQDISQYESTGSSGPITTGAAGTDRFDSDRTGVTGDSYGARDSYPSSGDRGDFVGQVRKDGAVGPAAAVQPGAGQSAIGTSDQEFYDPSRKAATGAYTDDNAVTKSALTGREGSGNATKIGHESTAATGNATDAETAPKEGIVDKIKNALW